MLPNQLALAAFSNVRVIAGADLKDIAALDGEGARRCRYLEDLCNGLHDVRIPVIAAVEGMAVCLLLSIQRGVHQKPRFGPLTRATAWGWI